MTSNAINNMNVGYTNFFAIVWIYLHIRGENKIYSSATKLNFSKCSITGDLLRDSYNFLNKSSFRVIEF